jgi:hypothetical protein
VLSLGGNPLNNTAIAYDGDNFFPFNISGVGITCRVAELVASTQKLKYELSVDGTAVYVQYLEHSGLAINEDLTWYFDHPLDVESGSTNHASIKKVTIDSNGLEIEGDLLLVCKGDELNGGSERYQTTVKNRRFEDKTLAYIDDIAAIVTGSVYKGSYDADTQTPSLAITGSELNGDFYRVSVGGGAYEVGDLIIFNDTTNSYDHIPVKAVTQNKLETSGLKIYDKYVKANYVSDIKDGSSLNPYSDISAAISNSTDGDSIYLDGEFTISSVIILPSDKSLYFYGNDNTKIKYASFSPSNDKIFYQSSSTCVKEFFFENIKFSNSGDYAIYIRSSKEVKFNNCEFYNNGWSGNGLSTVLADDSSNLGYDSTQADLQSFWAGSETSNGGAMRIISSAIVNVIDCKIYENLRGLRIQDCGIGGYGYISRNQCYNNIESGIYLASDSYNASNGCENFTVYNNASKYNANNGILVIGGINNVISLNIVEGNWNAGIMGWHVSNTRFRDLDLTNNNRSAYNGIGNNGDADSSISIAGDTARSGRSYIADILSTEVYNTGLGSITSRVGCVLREELQDISGSHNENLINIDNVGFKNQDYAIALMPNLDSVKVTVGDCRYIDTTYTNVHVANGYYYSLPFSNHHTNTKDLDFHLDNTGSQIIIKEGVNASIINAYGINTLQAVAFGSKIRIILKGSKKIQLEVEVSTTSINGSMVNSVLTQALVQLNDLFTNTSGFASGGNPVTNFALSGDDLTLTLQDGTSYTVDVTSLGVDENKFVSSGALNGSNLELTMNDSSVITIDASNMINGSSLPAISNDWFIAYGNNAGDEITYPSVVAAIKDKQPFYNGDFLEKGQEYIWTNQSSGYSALGVYTGSSETTDESIVFASNKWSFNFMFVNNTISTSSVGVDVASRFASGYTITNNTVFALRYGNDNYLYLLDVSNGGEVIIGRSNTSLVGDSVTIFFGGENQPNAKIPVMIKRFEQWSIAHDFDNSENGEWNNGVETDTVIKSNMTIGQGEKMILNVNYFGRAEQIGLGYSGASSGVNNASSNIAYRLLYNAAELLKSGNDSAAVGGEWTWNQNASNYYDPVGNGSNVGYYQGAGVNLGTISFVYNNDNSMILYHESNGEEIATLSTSLDGNPVNIYVGFNEAHPTQRIPSISKQTIGAGSQPLTTFAPDISNQSFDLTEGQAFSVEIALDSGSDIVNIFGEENAPSWMVLNQSTGIFSGTAPAYNGSSDAYVVSCKGANALGGITSFEVTLNVIEQTYTNTKSLKFDDGVNSYLGGNAALVTALERSGNGSGSSEAWTVAFWYKRTSSGQTGQTLFYFGHNDISNNGHIEIKQVQNGKIRLRYGSNNNYIQVQSTGTSIPTGNWTHVLVSYDGGTTGANSGSLSQYYSRFKIFANGVQQAVSNSQNNYGYTGSIVGQNYRFGRLVSGNYPKDGLLNQLAIWSSDQSSNVTGLYNNGDTQDISVLQAGVGSMNTNYLEPSHYYEIESSVSTIQDLIGTAHLVGYNFTSSDLVTDTP